MAQMHIYIVDDNCTYRQSTAWWLQGLGYQVSEFSSGTHFLEWLETYQNVQAACLLLDVRMPDMSGLELHEVINLKQINIPVIYMTGHGDVPIAVEAMKKGAITYLEKPLNAKSLEAALDSAYVLVQKGSKVGDLFEKSRGDEENICHAAFQRRISTLTPREKQVLDGVIEGKMNKVLAIDLGISIKTIELHRAQVMKKLNARNSTELIKMVIMQQATG